MSTDKLIKDGKKHVVIVGGGAAGMSCAATLAQHPDRFKVTVIERAEVCGGQATSISLDKEKYGTSWLNDGVQGGSPIFRHTFEFFKKYGHEPQEIKLQVAFGKGSDGFWTNCFPSSLVDKYSGDIKKFGKVLKIIKWTLPVLGLVPIRIMLRLFMFNKDFGDKMVYPLIALFLGTGNQTANVACAILERLFDDPNMKLWDYDPDTLLPNLPTMLTFPKLHDFYNDWAADLREKGVDIRLSTEVVAIKSRSAKTGVVLETRPFKTNPDNTPGTHTGPSSITETFSDLVLAVLADDAVTLLGKTSTWKERFVLKGAKFYDDITITHSDAKYFQKVYETEYDEKLVGKATSKVQEQQIEFSKGKSRGPNGEPPGFRPMYFTHSYKEQPEKIEMSFDCTNYQHQFRMDHDAEVAPVEFDKHVFQSIFLDKENRKLWTIDDIDEDKVIKKKWWHQLGHRWQHYVRVVPGMMFINGKNKTFFAGSWTLVNMHELACVSGIAVAYRLGADYIKFDDFAETFFKNYLLLSHGVIYKPSKGKNQ
ncbi:MAG: hypothetical protein M1814_001570 [Vezdaea aestivalis]|nr:MAG: hypothetical protein M1814_001570 [Vezdaea aestivalis]